jgi:hypothetical protein
LSEAKKEKYSFRYAKENQYDHYSLISIGHFYGYAIIDFYKIDVKQSPTLIYKIYINSYDTFVESINFDPQI